MYTIDKTGRDFIYKEEGVVLHSYKDQIGVITIGVGFTGQYPSGKPISMGDVITQAQCDSLFAVFSKRYEDAVNAGVKVTITQNQFNALVSLSYNIGTGGFLKSTLLKKINAGASLNDIQAQFNLWTKGGGNVLPVLVGRRKREFALYNTK